MNEEATMSSSVRSQPRPVLVHAAKALIAAAQSERASSPVHAPERQFYLGVEAAAIEVLHPELGMARTAEWLARQPLAYREGYLRTAAMISGARRNPERGVVFRLPDVN